MLMNDLIFITGGIKSGKSALALKCLETITETPLLLATARRTDNEMSARIDRHIADRSDCWHCIETPIDLPNALLTYDQPLLIDCLGVWITNLLIEQPNALSAYTESLLTALSKRKAPTVVISNESGLGVIGADALTRQFVDELGLINQQVAQLAKHMAITISGQTLWLKGHFNFTCGR